MAAAQGPDRLTAKIKSILQRDDLLQAEAELWERLHGWANMPHPSDALRGPRMRDPVRVLRQMRINAPLEDLLPAAAWAGRSRACRGIGTDRWPVRIPDSRSCGTWSWLPGRWWWDQRGCQRTSARRRPVDDLLGSCAATSCPSCGRGWTPVFAGVRKDRRNVTRCPQRGRVRKRGAAAYTGGASEWGA